MQKEFQDLHRVLLVALNDCQACSVIKCFYCTKFDVGCDSCRDRRCKPCVKFLNSLNFFYTNSIAEQWSCLCNFLFDLFRLHSITRQYFVDVRAHLECNLRDSFFIYSRDTSKKTLMTIDLKEKLYYTIENRTYKFYHKPL